MIGSPETDSDENIRPQRLPSFGDNNNIFTRTHPGNNFDEFGKGSEDVGRRFNGMDVDNQEGLLSYKKTTLCLNGRCIVTICKNETCETTETVNGN